MSFAKKMFQKDYICPYCFDRHPIYHVEFRCSNDFCEEKEVDEKKATFEGNRRPREENIVLKPELPEGFLQKVRTKMPSEMECHACNEETTVRICPSCHSELPSTVSDFESLIFAVIGAKETGKSHYISVLIEELTKHTGDTYNFTLEPLNDNTMKRYREQFYNPIYRNKSAIDATRSARADRDVRLPLLYSLKFYKKNLFNKEKVDKVITLAFFDTAGEDLDEENTMKTVNKYIYNSAGVILLLDPLQLDFVREKLPEDIELPKVNSDSHEILTRMTNLIRNAKQVKQDVQIDIPLAITFSKIDVVQQILDPSSQLRFPSRHEETDAFDLVDFENVQAEIEVLIKEWLHTGVVRSLKSNYKSYGYFGISSLGHNPGADKQLTEVKPYRVTDPFLWLLAEHKVIKTNSGK